MKPGFRAALGLAACGTMACANGSRSGGSGPVETPAPAAPSGLSGSAEVAAVDASPRSEAETDAAGMDVTSAPPALECQIRAEPRLKAGQPVIVHFRLVQRSAHAVYVLAWRTPLEGLRGDDFHVTREGVEIPYRGPLVKRGNPGAKSYLTLAPGTPLDAEVDLGLAYDLGKPGKYRVEFRGKIWDLVTQQADVPRPLDRHRPAPLQCAAIDVELT
jgi:peptidyl-Lys metalloendopeptidase